MTSFFDSNVILYMLGVDTAKAARAEALTDLGGVNSAQVLNEIASVLRRKQVLAWSEVAAITDTLCETLQVVPVTRRVHQGGLRVAERYQLAVYDGMIVAAALSAGCDTLWSEDMHDGLVVDGQLRIRNPFA